MEIRRLRKLLGYNNKHRDDVLAVFWQRLCCILAFLCLSILSVSAQTTDPDPVLLDKAVAYFNSEKYHEALLIFQQLDKRYKLNDRFRAYIGLCYYNEWEYKSATKYLDEVTPRLTMLAPHERSVYYFANAESHSSCRNTRQPFLSTNKHLLFATTTRKEKYTIGSDCVICLVQNGRKHAMPMHVAKNFSENIEAYPMWKRD